MDPLTGDSKLLSDLREGHTLRSKPLDLCVAINFRCRAGGKRPPQPAGQLLEERGSSGRQIPATLPLPLSGGPCAERDGHAFELFSMAGNNVSGSFSSDELKEGCVVVVPPRVETASDFTVVHGNPICVSVHLIGEGV